MSNVEQSIDIQAPLEEVYDHWARFEEYPKFMEDVLEVKKIDSDVFRWRTTIAGVEREWDAKITERSPNSRISWETASGPESKVVATFEQKSDNVTRLAVSMDVRPEKVIENVADMLGLTATLLEANLMRFKTFVETKHTEKAPV